MSSNIPLLFQPLKIGTMTLQHRVVLAPLTRYRASKSHVPILPLMKEYYSQRSSTPGTLLISEATVIAPQAGGNANCPGIWNSEQVSCWKEITDQVHANGCYIFMQLWALGRAALPDILESEGHSYVAPSPIPLSSRPLPPPREMTTDEVKEYVHLYAQAAKNAVEKAGFDGVEIHAANGYLIDQFLQSGSNQRSDEYGGSLEGRSKFGLDVVDAVVKAVGAERTAIRLSPWCPWQDMCKEDPSAQFSYFVSQLKAHHSNLAFLHIIEPRILSNTDRVCGAHESCDFIRDIWSPVPIVSAGGYTRENAIQAAEERGELIAFGRYYVSNPDLPFRLINNIPLARYDRNTFFGVAGDQKGTEHGYIDYPFAGDRFTAQL
ncbi:NADPH dehydrogenase 1 [Termitomyces sp. T112]|nr:NADPH dehydrogenase 1 [Termitomyces sp. T112]